jgi:hypothetical protein
MKLLLYSLVLFVLTACSSEEQRFVCGSEGFIIKNNSATLGLLSNLKFCSKEGTVHIYSSDCNKGALGTVDLFFDTVSLNVRESGNNLSIQCKRVN